MERGTGRTTRQMSDASPGAVFVWCEGRSIGYARDLARSLDRGDLRIVDRSYLGGGAERLLGLRREIVIDHATLEFLSPDERGGLRRIRERGLLGVDWAAVGTDTVTLTRIEGGPGASARVNAVAGSVEFVRPSPRELLAYMEGQRRRIEESYFYRQPDIFGIPYRCNCERCRNEEGAPARADALLRSWLTPDQLRQFNEDGCFDVIGSDSGKRYRINSGFSFNVHELDQNGQKVTAWCFGPSGALAQGDVLLGQKVALEAFETDALAVANRELSVDTWRRFREEFMTFGAAAMPSGA